MAPCSAAADAAVSFNLPSLLIMHEITGLRRYCSSYCTREGKGISRTSLYFYSSCIHRSMPNEIPGGNVRINRLRLKRFWSFLFLLSEEKNRKMDITTKTEYVKRASLGEWMEGESGNDRGLARSWRADAGNSCFSKSKELPGGSRR